MSLFKDVKELAGGRSQSKDWYRSQVRYGLESLGRPIREGDILFYDYAAQSQRLDVHTVQEKDFGSNSVAKLSSAFRNLIRTSFTAREATVFCKAKQLSAQSTTTVNIFVNDQQIESKRILRARLRCYYVCCTSKRSACTSYKEAVPYRLEAYNNIQNTL